MSPSPLRHLSLRVSRLASLFTSFFASLASPPPPIGGGPAPIGNPEVFIGGDLSSSLKGMAGAYNPLPFNIVAPPKRRASYKSPKKSPAKKVSKEEIEVAAAAVAESNDAADEEAPAGDANATEPESV